MTTESINSAELADVRPLSGGEYFSFWEKTTYYQGAENQRPACFACKQMMSSEHYVHAITQCTAAGKRIASMFKPGTCYSSSPLPEGGMRVIVGICEKHKRHGEILCRLTEDGIITAERISQAEKGAISRLEFNQLVNQMAFAFWSNKERDRTRQNWFDAWLLCLNELGRIPSVAERKELAERLWQERKEAQALEDWLAAEKKVSALYTTEA